MYRLEGNAMLLQNVHAPTAEALETVPVFKARGLHGLGSRVFGFRV